MAALAALPAVAAAPAAPPSDVRSGPAGPATPTSRPVVRRLLGALGFGASPTAALPAAEAEPQAPASESDGAQPDIRMSPRGTVEMHVADLDLSTVLTVLSMQSRRNIVASKSVSGKVTANLYDVTLAQALDAILAANGCGWRESGDFIHVYTAEELTQIQAQENPPVSRVFRLKYITAEDANKLLQPLLSKDGRITLTPKAAAGVAEGAKESAGAAMANEDLVIVLDTPDRLQAISKVIDEIDQRPKQVLVEATIVRAQLNEDNALGIDFNILGGVDFQMLNSTSPGITTLNTGNLPQPQMNNTSMTFRTDFNEAMPRGGFTFGIIKDSVSVFLRALEQVTDTAVIANPKIFALNKQRGEVIVGRRDGYVTTTITQTAAAQTVEFLETGTQLIFRPFIGDDGYIRMEIHPKDSTGGLTVANLPYENTTEVTTNIMVRDGHTILIGGLFREVTQAARGQLPYLGNLPGAGLLFRTTRDTTQREEVIILLTVKIVKDDERHAEAGRRLAEDVERYRVGMRQGLQAFGRERLAQAHYKWAVEHLARGDESKALWDARIATHLNPSFLAAIELTETLTNRRAWDDDGSTMRDFVAREILREKGITVPRYERPGPPFSLPDRLQGPDGFEDSEAGPTTRPAGSARESEARP